MSDYRFARHEGAGGDRLAYRQKGADAVTVEMLTINLNERGYDCGMCGAYGDHRHAVSVDDCGEPTARETGAGRVVCKPCHDTIHPPTKEERTR